MLRLVRKRTYGKGAGERGGGLIRSGDRSTVITNQVDDLTQSIVSAPVQKKGARCSRWIGAEADVGVVSLRRPGTRKTSEGTTNFEDPWGLNKIVILGVSACLSDPMLAASPAQSILNFSRAFTLFMQSKRAWPISQTSPHKPALYPTVG
jgi:hypothetical protein